MTIWSPEQVYGGIALAFAGAARHAERLNRCDAALGDGDLGETIQRCASSLAVRGAEVPKTVGAALRQASVKVASGSGSSLATVVAVGLLGAADAAGESASIALADLPALLEAALTAVMALGQVKRGDKTVVDGLFAISDALPRDESDLDTRRLMSALDAELVRLRDAPFRVGRGRVYKDAARGIDDPGMVALRLALAALCGVERNSPDVG